MIFRPAVWRWMWLAWLCWAAGGTALGGEAVTITGVKVDGRMISLKPGIGSNPGRLEPVEISGAARAVQIYFGLDQPDRRPAPRLRYKLEGRDEAWHELPTFMRVYVRFLDRAGQVIGSEALFMRGETPGWHGNVSNSEFVSRREQLVAPPRAAKMQVSLLSEELSIGVLAVDHMRVRVQPHAGGQSQVFDLSLTAGTDLTEPLGTPANWGREGSRAELAQLRTRPTPTPHPVLVLNDDDPAQYGNWELRPQSAVPVEVGDQLTLEWETAHSMGASQPGLAGYEGLRPGQYWFRVAAVKPNGEPMEMEAQLPLLVVPPWYRRWEVWTVGMVVAALGITGLGRVVAQRRLQLRLARIERERSLDRERVRIARDLHDRVGAGLAAIAMQNDGVTRECALTVTPETRRRLEFIGQTAGELVREVDEIVWAVNPANDTLERLANFVTHYTEQFLDSAGLRLRFEIPPTLPELTVVGTVRHSLMLAVMEALHNVVKHARATMVRLELRVQEGWLHVVVEDDGCGFEPNHVVSDGAHDGLGNMRRRLQEVGGQAEITSQPGRGSRVAFALPLGPGTLERR